MCKLVVLALIAYGAVAQPSTMPSGDTTYTMEKVEFDSQGVTLKGVLYKPATGGPQYPAVTIIGPVLFIKEQAPTQYATRFAQRGFVALVWDPRGQGESAGWPLRLESIQMKMEDLSASIDYLQSRADVQADAIAVHAVCQGVVTGIRAAIADERVRVLSTVAGNYLTPEHVLETYNNNSTEVARRLAAAMKAKADYEATGSVDYLPIVQTDFEGDGNRTDVLLPHKGPWLYYHQWVPHTRWTNMYAVMSEVELLQQNVAEDARSLRTPWLMVHSDASSGGMRYAGETFENAASPQKQTVHMGDWGHLQFYDDPYVLDVTVATIVPFYERVLGL